MSDLVAKCVLRVEVNDCDQNNGTKRFFIQIVFNKWFILGSQGAEAVLQDTDLRQKNRGQRKARDISVETFPSRLEGPREDWGLLPISSREQTPLTEKTAIELAEDKGEIGFFSGNPFVEVTKGILHLYKEE